MGRCHEECVHDRHTTKTIRSKLKDGFTKAEARGSFTIFCSSHAAVGSLKVYSQEVKLYSNSTLPRRGVWNWVLWSLEAYIILAEEININIYQWHRWASRLVRLLTQKRQTSVCLLQTETEYGSLFYLVGKPWMVNDGCCFSKRAIYDQWAQRW
jgi:hypothetical protein